MGFYVGRVTDIVSMYRGSADPTRRIFPVTYYGVRVCQRGGCRIQLLIGNFFFFKPDFIILLSFSQPSNQSFPGRSIWSRAEEIPGCDDVLDQ